MNKESSPDSDVCVRDRIAATDDNAGESVWPSRVASRSQSENATGTIFGTLNNALKVWVDGPFQIDELCLQPSTTNSASQTLNTIEFEIFKITEMARRWIAENGLSPYKLALTTGTSPSQVHRIMEPGWTPSLKLARRIASSLPNDWVSSFELDCNSCLPRLFHLHLPPERPTDPVTRLLSTVKAADAKQILDNLAEHKWSIRSYNYLSRAETSVCMAQHRESDLARSDYAPPPPRMTWSATGKNPAVPSRALLLHRVPLQIADTLKLYTIHIAEYSGLNWATQFWRIETSKGLTSQRQMDILKAYLAEKPGSYDPDLADLPAM